MTLQRFTLTLANGAELWLCSTASRETLRRSPARHPIVEPLHTLELFNVHAPFDFEACRMGSSAVMNRR